MDDRTGGADCAMVCMRCNVSLIDKETAFTYLGHAFSAALPRCPVCGQLYISEELVRGRIGEVEKMLENK